MPAAQVVPEALRRAGALLLATAWQFGYEKVPSRTDRPNEIARDIYEQRGLIV
jgi:hypothetical protein